MHLIDTFMLTSLYGNTVKNLIDNLVSFWIEQKGNTDKNMGHCTAIWPCVGTCLLLTFVVETTRLLVLNCYKPPRFKKHMNQPINLLKNHCCVYDIFSVYYVFAIFLTHSMEGIFI